MPKIVGKLLRELREAKSWSQERLSENTRIDKQTISRIERDKQSETRLTTVKKLADALGVDTKVLLGEAPKPEIKPSGEPSKVSISLQSRNALHLLHERYFVQPWQVIEIAPLLFCWAAETSLRQRKLHIEEYERSSHGMRDAHRQVIHLRAQDFAELDEKIAVEKESIQSNDLFGYEIDNAGHADFNLWDDNPFSNFLGSLFKDSDDVAEFIRFPPLDYPEYKVCKGEAERLVGGDSELAESILDGYVALHEMPKEIKDSSDSNVRADWVRKKRHEFNQSILDKLSRRETSGDSK